jgi:hypothetical protein
MNKFLISVLFLVLQIQAASTVSGFAVAAQWEGGYDGGFGGFGKIIRYDIVDGQTVNTTVLYDGRGRFATINPDGQRIAFIRHTGELWANGYLYPSDIVVMSASGGTPEVVVEGLPDGYTRSFLDWPEGDWLYYGLGSTSTDGSYEAMASNIGFSEVWKVNVNTKEKMKIHSFMGVDCQCDLRIWQWNLNNNATRAVVRPIEGPNHSLADGLWRYELSSFPDGVVKLERGDENDAVFWGCGDAISPDGSHVMYLTGRDHQQVAFQNWDKEVVAEYNMGTMAGWGEFFGRGMDNSRWSSNSDKWICVASGWDNRGGAGGSNQVLINWIDHEIVRTSNGLQGSDFQCETGDFWVANGEPSGIKLPFIRQGLNHNVIGPTYSVTYDRQMLHDLTRGIVNIWDITGRTRNTEKIRDGARAIFIMKKTKAEEKKE